MEAPLFNPSPQRTLLVIGDLIDPDLSLRDVAERHDTTVAALTLWMALPDTTQELAVFQTVFSDRIRLLAAGNLPSAISTLNRILVRFNKANLCSDPTLSLEQRQRATDVALRAASIIARLCTFRPLAFGTPARHVSQHPAAPSLPADSHIAPAHIAGPSIIPSYNDTTFAPTFPAASAEPIPAPIEQPLSPEPTPAASERAAPEHPSPDRVMPEYTGAPATNAQSDGAQHPDLSRPWELPPLTPEDDLSLLVSTAAHHEHWP